MNHKKKNANSSKSKTLGSTKPLDRKLAKKNSTKSSAVVPSDSSSYDKSWRKMELAPAKNTTHENLLAADQIVRTLNGSYYRVAENLWKCQAKAIIKKTQEHKLEAKENLKQTETQQHYIVLTLGGANYLLETTLPLELRQSIEKMTEPFQMEEIPHSIALAIISLKLNPLLQEVLALNANVKDYYFATNKSAAKSQTKYQNKYHGKNKAKWLQELDLSIEVKALPLANEELEEAGSREQSGKQPIKPFEFRLHLACANAKKLCNALQPVRKVRQYPPNLHVAWNFYTTPTTISLKELRALEEGDVLLLA